ncbi:MAG: hypothetical protein Q8P18_21455 [Pseudomonadota bacterium]|nr:hypothetical protein [Pseudomonadota bacterium]
MPIDVYWKRARRLREGASDVFIYDSLSQPLRVQIVHIWSAVFRAVASTRRTYGRPEADALWARVHGVLLEELGVFTLVDDEGGDQSQVERYFLNEPDAEKVLSIVELVFQLFHEWAGQAPSDSKPTVREAAKKALSDLNARFLEHAVGYRFEAGSILRVDSTFLHQEATKPALMLLAAPEYEGPNDEFLRAHEHHRHGRQEECLVDCLKAFESTMKVICDRRKWPYATTATASKLLQVIFDNHLLPDHVQSEMTALRSVLESGVPTVRNKTAGHGQGGHVRKVPAYVAAFALHSTAANVLLLVEADKALA